MVMLAAAFVVLVTPIPMFAKGFGRFPAVLFFAVPLIALAIVVPTHWTACSGARASAISLDGFALLNVSGAVIGFTLMKLSEQIPCLAESQIFRFPN